MKKLETYRSLCTEVYDLSKPTPPEDAYAFYRNYVQHADGCTLEPMCGTGRFLIPLMEEGFDVQGFDASDEMLNALHHKASGKNLNPTVWKGFVEELSRKEKYPLIFIPTGSFCLITDELTVKSILHSFYHHMTDEGVLLFEVDTIHSLSPLNVWQDTTWHKENGDAIKLSQFTTFENGICSIIGKYDLIANDTIIRTEIEEYKIKIYRSDKLIKLLKSCGFSKIRSLKAFDNKAPDKQDEVVVYECRK